jgi:hypothetical protein
VRGLINPLLDKHAERDARFREAILEAERLSADEAEAASAASR